jgi:hypothetical protein
MFSVTYSHAIVPFCSVSDTAIPLVVHDEEFLLEEYGLEAELF